MDAAAQALFIIEIVLAWSILTAIQYPLRKQERRILRTVVFLLKVIMIPVMAFLAEGLEWGIAYTYDGILCAIYVALIADVIASICEYAYRRIMAWLDDGDGTNHRFDYRIGIPFGLSICVFVMLFGTVNGETIHTNTYEWQADGLEQEHTFAFAADLHAGSSLSMGALSDFCKQVNESDAEFLVLGGDITDEMTSYEEMMETFSTLSTIDVPIYMVYGNHDKQSKSDYVGGRTYSDEQLLNAINDAGITLLVDEYVQVAKDLVLLGREDISAGDERKDWSELENPFEGGALIVIDHQPYDEEQLEVEVSALQLSGHTHAGQLWPLKFIYGVLLGLPVMGEYGYDGTRLFVTPGLSCWAPTFRTEGHSCWELITLHP